MSSMSNVDGLSMQGASTNPAPGCGSGLSDDADMASPTASNPKPRSGKINFSVDALLSGTKKSPVNFSTRRSVENGDDGGSDVSEKSSEMQDEARRYRDFLIMEQERQRGLQSRELLARLSPLTQSGLSAFPSLHHYHHHQARCNAAAAAVAEDIKRANTERQDTITVKDFSRTGLHEESSSPVGLADDRLSINSSGTSPKPLPRRTEDDDLDDDDLMDDDRITSNRSVSPIRREIDNDRSDSEAPRSLEGDGSCERLMDVGSGSRSEDLNVMDSDCEMERDVEGGRHEKEKSSPVVPQPIHPVQRPTGPYLSGPTPGWSPTAFPHSLAGFAWLPPPPHPHNPHGHLYTPQGGPTSPNGEQRPSLITIIKA